MNAEAGILPGIGRSRQTLAHTSSGPVRGPQTRLRSPFISDAVSETARWRLALGPIEKLTRWLRGEEVEARTDASGQFTLLRVEVKGKTEVARYLDSHPGILAAAEMAAQQCRTEFGPDARLILSVYNDPEYEDEYLTLELRLSTYDDSTMPKIREIDKAYESSLSAAAGWFVLTTDFRPLS